MERYRPLGSHSCKPVRSPPEAEDALRHAASATPVATLHEAVKPCELFIVGGAVRDALTGTPCTDLDLTTSLSAEEVKRRCEGRGLRVIETGIQHGTVLLVIDGIHLEVTTFRRPADRATQINAHDIGTDLSGRDFTINAIAFCIASGKLLDPFSGIEDLAGGIVRAVGDPYTRFCEDPLRILRMVRFGDAQGRTIEPLTLEAARMAVPQLSRASVERIRHELDQIIVGPCPAAALRKILDIGALPATIPELMPAVNFEQNRYHIHDVFDHTLAVLDRTPNDRILRWAAVFHDIGKPHTLSIDAGGERHFYSHEVVSSTLCLERMKQLKFSADDTKKISSIVRHHMRPMNCGPAGVRRLIRDLGDELSLWRRFKDADSSPTLGNHEVAATAQAFDALLALELQKRATPSYGRLAVNGEDLKALGVKEGPAVGKILKQLEELIIEDPTKNTKEILLSAATSLIAEL